MPGPSTRLAAVNSMLSAVAQAPVDSLGSGVNVIAQTAEGILDEAQRDVLSQSWFFNTEERVEFTPDANGFITIGDDIYHADSEISQENFVKRDQRLYDLTEHTFVFQGVQELTVVYDRSFEEIPETARSYITARARRILAERFDRDVAIVRAELGSEAEAFRRLTKEDAEIADANPLVDNRELYFANHFGGRSIIERGI